MSSPTTRATNVWEVNGGDDILQVNSKAGTTLGGINSSGAGFGALAGGGGNPGGIAGDIQFNSGSTFTNAAGINSGSVFKLNASGALQIVSASEITFSAANVDSLVQIGSGTGGIAVNSTGSIGFEGTDVNFTADTTDVNVTANSGGFNVTTGGSSGVTIVAGGSTVFLGGANIQFQLVAVPQFVNNAAAIAGGLSAGMLYRTGADPDTVCIVHNPF